METPSLHINQEGIREIRVRYVSREEYSNNLQDLRLEFTEKRPVS